MPGAPVRAVRPDAGQHGEGRKGPRVPGPDAEIARVQHARGVAWPERVQQRIEGRRAGIEGADLRRQRPLLHQVIARAARERRQAAFRGQRVREDVGRVRALVDRGTADLGQPDRLRSRDPGGRLRQFGAGHALAMGIAPPAGEILLPKDPGLADGAIRDRQALLRRPARCVGVVPVESLAGALATPQIGGVLLRTRLSRVEMARPVAPVADRRVPVDPDRVDLGRGPERIERKAHLLPASQDMRAVLGPVRGVGETDGGTEHGPHLRGQRAERRHEWIDARGRAHPRQPDHLRADDEGIHAAGRLRQPGVVQDVAAEAPFGRLGADDGAVLEREVGRKGRPGEGGDLRAGRSRAVGTAGLARRGHAGDAATPGIGCLPRRSIRVGQRVVRRHVHHDEGIERDLEAAPLQLGDQGQHGRVGGRAAIARTAAHQRHEPGLGAAQARHGPFRALRRLGLLVDPGGDGALAGPEIVAEPADDEVHALEVRAQRLQLVERGHDVAVGLQLVGVLLRRGPEVADAVDAGRLVGELAGAGDQVHGPDLVLQPGSARTTSKANCGTRLPKASRGNRSNTT